MLSYFNGFLTSGRRYTNFPRFQGAQRPNQVRVQSSSCCFSRELVSFIRPRELVSFIRPRELVSFIRPRELVSFIRPRELVSFIRPRELVSFIRPRELVSFNPQHVTHSPPIGKRI